jgi:hypothetical protein
VGRPGSALYVEGPGGEVRQGTATLFVGNTAESQGFAFQSYRSDDFEAFFAVIICDIILPSM